jgi:hypothetical protein
MAVGIKTVPRAEVGERANQDRALCSLFVLSHARSWLGRVIFVKPPVLATWPSLRCRQGCLGTL